MDTLSDEDEAVASDLDLHALIASQNPLDFDAEPFQSAEEVIKEIDDLMQVMSNLKQINSISERRIEFIFDLQDPPSSPETSESMHQSPDTPECAMSYRLATSIHPDSQWFFFYNIFQFLFVITLSFFFVCVCESCAELETWSVSQLNEFLSELEWRVQHHSETLIAELALRDELEFEKELKNTFISLLLNVQNKRRQVAANQKKPTASTPNSASAAKNGNKTLPSSYNLESKVRPIPTLFL